MFRELHRPGDPFILANAWDLGSASVLAALGAKAIGTTSQGHAFTLGLRDGGQVSRDAAIGHAKELAKGVAVPVSADLENGYGHSEQDVVATIEAAAAAGVAGCCIEDIRLPANAAYDRDVAVSRIAAAVSASPDDFFLVARADGLITRTYDLEEAIARVQAFAAVGADGVYIPNLTDMASVERVCRSVEVPVNVLVNDRLARQSLADFAEAGVARVSLGSSLARLTHKVLIDAGRDLMAHEASFASLAQAAGHEVDALVEAGRT